VGISSGFNKISEQLAWSGSSLPLNAGLLRLQSLCLLLFVCQAISPSLSQNSDHLPELLVATPLFIPKIPSTISQ
jgi:hypothetical protein